AGRDFTDAVVADIDEQKIPARIDYHPCRGVDSRRARGPAISGKAGLAVTGVGRDNAVGGNFADSVAAVLGDVDATVGGNGNPIGYVELRRGRQRAVSAVTGRAGPGDGRGRAQAVHLVDFMGLCVRGVEIAGRVDMNVLDVEPGRVPGNRRDVL